MFLKKKMLKRLMKEAYKGGLRVAATDTRYYLGGSYWELDILKEYMPKEILAAVLELTGWIPETGESYCATKDGNQVDMDRREVPTDGMEEGITVTDLLLRAPTGVLQRILQDESSGSILLVSNSLIEIVDNKELENGESPAEGPWYDPTGILYENNVMRWHVIRREDEKKESLLKELIRINLTMEDDGYGMDH